MSDNTTVQQGNGGDTIRTDAIVESDGVTIVKTQVVKLQTGTNNVDGGLVSDSNGLPVEDRKLRRLLEDIYSELCAQTHLLKDSLR